MRPTVPLERLHRLLIRLHPKRFRTRFGLSVHDLFREWLESGATHEVRVRRARNAVREAASTLFTSWGHVAWGHFEKILNGGDVMLEMWRQ